MRWGITYLLPDTKLSIEQNRYILNQATEMHYKGEEERKITLQDMEGIIHTEGKFQTLGVYGGQHFRAEVETENGKSNIAFLVCDMTDHRGAFQFSMN